MNETKYLTKILTILLKSSWSHLLPHLLHWESRLYPPHRLTLMSSIWFLNRWNITSQNIFGYGCSNPRHFFFGGLGQKTEPKITNNSPCPTKFPVHSSLLLSKPPPCSPSHPPPYPGPLVLCSAPQICLIDWLIACGSINLSKVKQLIYFLRFKKSIDSLPFNQSIKPQTKNLLVFNQSTNWLIDKQN